MDYEKKYKDALERARNYHKQLLDEDNPEWASEIEKIFTELAESEDEKIRKELIFYLGDMPEDTELRNGVTNRDVLVWLEKQGERKPAWRPSKAQMVALHATQNGVISTTLLQSLYNDLEKL